MLVVVVVEAMLVIRMTLIRDCFLGVSDVKN
jgi:hypothetical protein